MKPAVIVSVVFLLLVAVLHILRLVFAVTITVDGTTVPMWASVLACIGPGALGVWLWRSQRRAA
jgi:hypothetical protein